MIVLFTPKETVIERALGRALGLLLPKAELRIVVWSEKGDRATLKKCLKEYHPLVLVVSTHGCSADQLGHLFQSGLKPAPQSLIVFGPGAERIVREANVQEWVNGRAFGERVVSLPSVLKLLQKAGGSPVMTNQFRSECHDLKSVLMGILDDRGWPPDERWQEILRRVDAFAADHEIDFDGDDVVTRFFRKFREFLSLTVSKAIEGRGGEESLRERAAEYIIAVGSIPDMLKLPGSEGENLTSEHQPVIHSPAVSDKRIVASVLVVEDNHHFAANLIEHYRAHLAQVDRFNIKFLPHVPIKDAEGKVIETLSQFRERLIKRIRCQSRSWQDESLTRLQAVIMDYAMDNFAPDNEAGGRATLSGIDLSRDIQRLRPGVDLFLLTGKDIFEIVEQSDGLFERAVWKHDPTSIEIDELFWHLVKNLERKYRAPFWEALREFTRRPVIVMHAMSLARGKSAKKSNVLEDFVDFYKDNYFMAETSATIEPLDSLLHPTGSILQAQRSSARAFGAKRTYFVTNGTSTANKIVLQAILAPGDAVLVDRNCHISHHYGISLARARPYYLEPYNLRKYGISGGIPLNVLSEALIKFLETENRGVTDKEKLRLPKAVLLTNCTFDGIVCRPREVIRTVWEVLKNSGLPEERLREIVFLFDEAWFAYGRFHPQFVENTGMATAHALCEEERLSGTLDDFYSKNLRIYVTQSTHKTLSAFRQASMIHVWDPVLEANEVAALRFEEAFLTHTSTSPHSGIIASLDVARRQAELEGCALVEDALIISNSFRENFRRAQVGDEARNLSRVGRCFDVLTEYDLIPDQYRDQFLLDPSKITLHIKKGYTGSQLKKLLLMEHDIQFNKHSDNTVLLMVNAGGSTSSMGTLKNVLTKLARNIEQKETQADGEKEMTIPSFTRFWDVEIEGYNPGERRDLAFFFNNEAAWKIEWAPIGDLTLGRASATFVVPYPPGYPMLVPGQVIDEETNNFLKSLGTGEIHGTRFVHGAVRQLATFVPH
jgi:arginine decarboxylase